MIVARGPDRGVALDAAARLDYRPAWASLSHEQPVAMELLARCERLVCSVAPAATLAPAGAVPLRRGIAALTL